MTDDFARPPKFGPFVRWRNDGHVLAEETDLLRFEVVDINRVITSSAAASDLYSEVLGKVGHQSDWQVLTLSCFAITNEWSPIRLAHETGFATYRVAPARTLQEAGYAIWPTEIFLDGSPDPRNEVHYDLVVVAGPRTVPMGLVSDNKSERRAAREELRPMFESVLNILSMPQSLDARANRDGTGTMDAEEESR